MKTFHYRVPRVSSVRPPLLPMPRVDDEDVLTGTVMGKKASKAEELFARRLYFFSIGFWFRYIIPVSGFNVSGMRGEIEVDFLCENGLLKPIQLDGEFSHKGAAMWADDMQKDIAIDAYFKGLGGRPVIRIPFYKTNDKEAIDRAIREYVL